jgi:hypothetical protein
MRISVEKVRPVPYCSISFGYGYDVNGVAITFAGDRRTMQHLAEQIAATDSTVTARVEDWQLWAEGPNAPK